jgi:hypothetical protein
MRFKRWFHQVAVQLRKQVAVHPYRVAFTVVIVTASMVTAIAVIGREQRDFVSKCMKKHNDQVACACTYAALPDMPKGYEDVARAWAHKSFLNHQMASIRFLATDFGKAVKNQIPLASDNATVDPLAAKSWWSSLKSSSGRVVMWVGKKVVPMTQAEIANDTLSGWMKARDAYGKHCNGVLDRMIGKAEVARSTLAKGADEIGVDSLKKAGSLATSAKTMATKAGGWVWDKATGWRK